MESSSLEKKKITLLVLGVVAFILVIVVIAVISTFISSQHATTIVNQEAATASGSTLTSSEYVAIGSALHSLVEENNGLAEDAEVTAAIREASYSEETTENGYKHVSFILDVDTISTTYYVSLTFSPEGEVLFANFGCTTPAVSKYPNTFCVGSENISSISATLSSSLPYTGYINGTKAYTLEHSGGATYLTLKVYTDCDDQATHDTAVAAAEAWVKEQVPELDIPIEEEDFDNTCRFGVDGAF